MGSCTIRTLSCLSSAFTVNLDLVNSSYFVYVSILIAYCSISGFDGTRVLGGSWF